MVRIIAAVTHSRLDGLIALRDALAADIESGMCANLPAASRELRMVLAEIDVLSAAPEDSNVTKLSDHIASKRAAANS